MTRRAIPLLAIILFFLLTGVLLSLNERKTSPAPSLEPFPLQENAHGLLGTYFDTTAPPASRNPHVFLRRIDSKIDFNGSGQPPGPGMSGTNFSASWTGMYHIDRTGEFTFSIISTGGVRLWLDGELRIDDWGRRGTGESNRFTEMGQGWHSLRLDYRHYDGSAMIRLLWTPPHGRRMLIPTDQLIPTNPAHVATDSNIKPMRSPRGWLSALLIIFACLGIAVACVVGPFERRTFAQIIRQIIGSELSRRLILPCLVVAIFMGAVEFTAQMFYQYGSLVNNFVPSVCKDGYYFLKSDEAFTLRKNPSVLLPSEDRAHSSSTIRIVIFGDSTTAGWPYTPELSYAHFLQRILARRWPHARFEVYNAAYFAQTYRFAYRAFRDSMVLFPDYVIFYTGNNECYPQNLYWTARRRQIPFRLLEDWNDRLRRHSVAYGVLQDRLERHRTRLPELNATGFNATLHIRDAIDSFKDISKRIIEEALQKKCRVIFITPLRNLKDFPPNPSVAGLPPLSLLEVRDAANQAELAPDLQYRIGKYFLAQGQRNEAKRHFEDASDRTIGAGRVQSHILAFLRELPANYAGVQIVDAERAAEARVPGGIVGDETVIDWCHLTAESHYEVARQTAQIMRTAFTREFGPSRREFDSFNQTLRTLSSPGAMNPISDDLDRAGYIYLNRGLRARSIAYFKECLRYSKSTRNYLGLCIAQVESGDISGGKRTLKHVLAQNAPSEIASLLHIYRPADDVLFGRLIHALTESSPVL